MARGDEVGQTACFDAFYESRYAATLRIVFGLCGSWPVAEELTQEAFLRALTHWPTVSQLERPDSWVRRVAINLATSAFRRRVAEARALLRFGHTAQRMPAEAPVDLTDFIAAVRALPRRQAQAVVLRYVDDLTIDQIADVMGCAPGTVKAHLNVARKRMVPLMGAGADE